mgnify:CR=1 FL=1
MEKFTSHTGIAVPLRRSNVDTDQIIPAVYLKRITRTGFEDGLFAGWRREPDFVLNQPAYRDGSILLVGPDFGTGSSREHAVWALQNYGFKAVVGTRFGDIFRNNSGKAGLLVASVDEATSEALFQIAEASPGCEISIDLPSQTITAEGQRFYFDIDDYTKHRLLEGLDDIASTLQHEDEIAAFEARRPSWKPTTLPQRV